VNLLLREGLRKNKRGSRSRFLKLEIDERITASLSENDGTYHRGPNRGDRPGRQTHHCRLKCAIGMTQCITIKPAVTLPIAIIHAWKE